MILISSVLVCMVTLVLLLHSRMRYDRVSINGRHSWVISSNQGVILVQRIEETTGHLKVIGGFASSRPGDTPAGLWMSSYKLPANPQVVTYSEVMCIYAAWGQVSLPVDSQNRLSQSYQTSGNSPVRNFGAAGGEYIFMSSLSVPHSVLIGATAVLPLLWLALRVPKWAKSFRHRPAGLCRVCSYDLRATPNRCPECGTVARSG